MSSSSVVGQISRFFLPAKRAVKTVSFPSRCRIPHCNSWNKSENECESWNMELRPPSDFELSSRLCGSRIVWKCQSSEPTNRQSISVVDVDECRVTERQESSEKQFLWKLSHENRRPSEKKCDLRFQLNSFRSFHPHSPGPEHRIAAIMRTQRRWRRNVKHWKIFWIFYYTMKSEWS